MKTHLIVSVLALGLVALVGAQGCMPGASLDKDKLVKTASFDTSCPAEKIRIVSADDHGMDATGNYALDVCGQPKKYKRAGTLYYDAEKGGPYGLK